METVGKMKENLLRVIGKTANRAIDERETTREADKGEGEG